MHAAHRCPQYQPKMIHSQPFFDQLVLQRDHVRIVILRKVRMHAIARLTRFPIAYIVRNDEEVLARIKQLSRLEEHVGKYRTEELAATAAGAVQDENSVRRPAAGIFDWRAERCVVHLQLRHSFARLKMKIVDYEVAFMRSGRSSSRGLSLRWSHSQGRKQRHKGTWLFQCLHHYCGGYH